MSNRHREAKLRALDDESLKYGDGYRGHLYVQWSIAETKRETTRTFEIYAAGCRFCDQYWGWTYDLNKAIRLACAMGIKGCPRCEKRLSKRKFARLQEHVESARVRVCSDVFADDGAGGFGCRFCKKRVGKGTYAKVQKIMRKKLAS